MVYLTLYIDLQVELSRKFIFRHAKKSFPEDAIPIIAANMDTVGTFEMAKVLAQVFVPKTGPYWSVHSHLTVYSERNFYKLALCKMQTYLNLVFRSCLCTAVLNFCSTRFSQPSTSIIVLMNGGNLLLKMKSAFL